jgi:tetratricopeptide (TPR) repeat protein
MHFLIGPLIVCYILAVPALGNVAVVLLGLAALAIGPIWSHRALGAIALSAAPLLAVVLSASAQTDQQIEWCNGEDNATRELSLSGCTAMIQSGAYVGEELAIVFNNRGIAYFKSGQLETAIQDYDQAIRLRPNFLSALISRGFAYLNMKNYGAAIAAFDAALNAYPENAPSLYGRALAKRANGDTAGANAEIAAAQRLDPRIAQELVDFGVNLEPPPEFAVLSPAAASVSTSAPQVERSALPPAPGEGAPLPPTAAPGQTSTPPDEKSAVPSAPAEETASLPPAAAPVLTSAPPVEQSTAPPPAPAEKTASLPLPAEVTEALIERGDELLSTGDIVAARLAYERAAADGNRVAATGVAKTYDPNFLAQSGVRGLRSDPKQAALWYSKAAAAGSREAQERLKRLRAQFPQ